MERLGQNFGAGWCRRSARQRDCGKTGNEDNLHRWIEFGAAARKFDPVNAGHDNVRQEQVKDLSLECLKGAFAIFEILNIVSCTPKRRTQESAHRIIVFCQQDFAH